MKLNLNKNWYVLCQELECKDFAQILNKSEGWIETDIPCDIHEPLIREGIIQEPLDGMNCFDSEWIETKSWWFKKSFGVGSELLQGDEVELVLESLDIGAEIILNEQLIGCHKSAFYPFRMDVKDVLREGENQLLIRLTSGLDQVNVDKISGYTILTEEERRPGRGDARRAFLRKPQYAFGWDWGPKVSTCGIVKGAWLESHGKAVIKGVHTFVKALQLEAIIGLCLEIENLHLFSTLVGKVRIDVTLEGEKDASCELEVLLKSGLNYIDTELEIENAKLWWPSGMGEQPLYTVKVSIDLGSKVIHYPEYKYGIRTVSIDTTKLREGEQLFAVTVNGVRTFCKGANWIPADSIYSRVTDEKYAKLLLEAKEANFNMLRIWGGGLYERDVFYEQCDRMGIMLWHDFMFACSEYPDDEGVFLKEVEQELDYQTKKLRNHPSLVLWCGNNEIHWAFGELLTRTVIHGSKIYNYVAPAVVRRNCPDIPYWNSSPYGGALPNEGESGDRHHWNECMMHPEMQKRITPEEYDQVNAKFVSEYGYVGPMKRSSIEKYLNGAPFDINGEVWQHHNNTFEKDTVLAGIAYHYCDTGSLDIDSYLLYAGLCQGLMYGYSLEAFRYSLECSGGLFWMYSDCWGETGWTIIDYYLTRKISYYFVKRAFAPVKFILREGSGLVRVVGINDEQIERDVTVEYGYASFDGTKSDLKKVALTLTPHSRNMVLSFNKGDLDATKGVYFVRSVEDDAIPLALLRTGTYRELEIPKVEVSLDTVDYKNGKLYLTVSSSGFAHAVHFKLHDEIRLSDEYFDMLPGECRIIEVYDVPEDMNVQAIKVYWINKFELTKSSISQ